MQEVLSSEVLNNYVKLKSVRAVARQTGLSREKVRGMLEKNHVKILTSDESSILRRMHPRKSLMAVNMKRHIFMDLYWVMFTYSENRNLL
jgi:hypothetical protein